MNKLVEIKIIIRKVFILIIDILRFGFHVGRQVILPFKRKKGNILSSLFIFFVGIIERVDSFEYGVFAMDAILRRKYIKRCLLVVAGLLFLLSSFEWTGETIVNTDSCHYLTQVSDTRVKKSTIGHYAEAAIYSATNFIDRQYPTFTIIGPNRFPFPSPVKTFLLTQRIRI